VKTEPGSPCSNQLIDQSKEQDNTSRLEDSPKCNLLNKNDSANGSQRSYHDGVYNNLKKSTSHELNPVQ